ncbi:MAG: hypothetical protein WCT23_02925 [Candidatus Neomarinimicrobiota bacterium]
MKKIIPKIVVALAAIVLWLLIVSSNTYVGVIDVPLTAYEPREDKTLAQALPSTVKIRVEGSGRSLYFQRFTKKSELILDIGAISSSEKISLKDYFSERSNQVRLQGDMRFLELIYPDSINIRIDNKISKEVDVLVRSDISLKPGFVLLDDEIEYKISISGPEGMLENINKLETERYLRENVDIAFSENIEIVNPDPQLVRLFEEKIEVFFPVEMIGEIIIPNIAIDIKNKPDDLDIQFIPNTVSLRVTGGNTQIQSLRPEDFKVYFDYLSQWFPNKNYYPVKVLKPENVLDVISVDPEQVEVVVLKKQEVD